MVLFWTGILAIPRCAPPASATSRRSKDQQAAGEDNGSSSPPREMRATMRAYIRVVVTIIGLIGAYIALLPLTT